MAKNKGWECPKCGKVFAPWVASCDRCVGVATATWYPDWTYRPRPWVWPYGTLTIGCSDSTAGTTVKWNEGGGTTDFTITTSNGG